MTCLVSGFICYYFYRSLNISKNNIENYNTICTEFDKQIEEEKKKVNELVIEKEKALNIAEQLQNIKQTYYENVVKVDNKAKYGDGSVRVCYLTFDDGPYKITSKFLDVLEEKDVLATFFCVKKDGYDDIYKRERDNGHTIGNHSATHTIRYVYRSEETFIEDIKENQNFIYDLLGIKTNVMRFPGGSNQATYMGLNKAKIVDGLQEIGYGYVDWSHMTGDGDDSIKQDPNVYLHNIIDNIDNKNVITILMHDYSECTLKCLPTLIDTLKEEGFIFLPLYYDCSVVKKA